MKLSKSFFVANSSLLLFGVLFTFSSSFGQTFFISLFKPHLQNEFVLTETEFSTLYAVATIGSAFTLTWLGRFIDSTRLPKFSSLVILGLAIALSAFALSYSAIFLLLALYGLRLFGQGLMSHTSITAMAKFFDKNRGKAISIAAVGHPIAEAVLPITIVLLLGFFDWRIVIILCVLFVVLTIPFSRYLLFTKRNFTRLKMYIPSSMSVDERKASRPVNIIKTRAFWAIAPLNFSSATIGTAYIFFQLKIGDLKDWSPAFIALSFSGYAIGNFCMALVSGWLTDLYSARTLYPLYILPFILGLLFFIFNDSQWSYVVFITSIGVTNGFGATVKNAVLAEVYGTKIVGSVRSLFITVMVFATAVGPVLFGFYLDRGINFTTLSVISLAFFILMMLNAFRVYRIKSV
ncbi:MFS transporter [Planktosalinus lacus]|uniref:MFS transporter n=1 Tax=Planktosalinus lacus TaxID=1526573 RepID=A0A8J2V9Z2_9FLAO|nr:MFS transporter [Planktosalinus lacus]